MTTSYTLSRVRFKDSEVSTRPVEGHLLSVTLHNYMHTYKSAPTATAILNDDYYITVIEGKNVKQFKKADFFYIEYEFSEDMKVDDFIK